MGVAPVACGIVTADAVNGTAERLKMSELGDKVKTSIDRIRGFAPKNGEGYYLAFSGGKDSIVCINK